MPQSGNPGSGTIKTPKTIENIVRGLRYTSHLKSKYSASLLTDLTIKENSFNPNIGKEENHARLLRELAPDEEKLYIESAKEVEEEMLKLKVIR